MDIYNLIYAGKQLENDWLLSDCDIEQGSTIYLVKRLSKPKELSRELPRVSDYVKVHIVKSGVSFLSIEMYKHETTQTLKEAIEGKRSIPVSCQSLVYRGSVLDNSSTLSYYHIYHSSVIDLIEGDIIKGLR
jgi:hypothetical protein